MKNNPETLNLAMDYAAVMESCAAYVTVQKPKMSGAHDVVKFVRPILEAATSGNSQEAMFCILLNSKNRVIEAPPPATMGTLNSSLAHPREIFREAVRKNAAAVIIVHNHPSGDSTPSAEDVQITKQCVMAGQILGISVLDHIVLGTKSKASNDDGYVSMRERDLCKFDAN